MEPSKNDRWYAVILTQRPDCMQKPLVIYARAFTATHSECRVSGAKVVLPRELLQRVAEKWELVTDPETLKKLG